MVFSSHIFIFIFLPLFLLFYLITVLLKNIQLQNICLIVFSLIFYSYRGLAFLPMLLFSIFVNYIFAIRISKSLKNKKTYLIIAVVFNVLVLFVFKYLNLFDDIFTSLTNIILNKNYDGFIPNIALPLGISFYTFQILTYVIDVYKNEVNVNYNFFEVLLYAMLFPQLIAGPIVRYSDVQYEIQNRYTNIDKVYIGLRRFMIGFAKKILFANACGNIANYCFNMQPFTAGTFFCLLAVICYTIQIYLDFSAYSDMAIGIGQIIGFNFRENFNDPFISKSLTEFFRRWHMTLTSFLTDYIYIPLGGNRKGVLKTYINIIIVFAISGIWHGANINYLVWGLYNAFFLVVERLFLKKKLDTMPMFISIIYTNVIWMFGMIIFYFDSFDKMYLFLLSMLSRTDLNVNYRYIVKSIFNYYFLFIFTISILLCTPVFKNVISFFDKKKFNIILDIIIVLLFIYAIMEMSVSGYNPFIYFRF